jgi:two-component system sensor histidine kinase RpfC
LRGILQHGGHQITVAENGDEALDQLSTQSAAIDIVILDMNMPGMSGLEVLKAYQFIDTANTVPVIMLTADATPEARQSCEQAGADAFLTKPVNSRALLEKVAQLSAGLAIDAESESERNEVNNELLDEEAVRQLIGLGDAHFLQTLVASFKHDAQKHIKLIKTHCHDDYLTFRESLHALKGSATEMSAYKLAARCASAEKVKPDELGQANVITLAEEIEQLFDETVVQLELRFSSSLHDSHRTRH